MLSRMDRGLIDCLKAWNSQIPSLGKQVKVKMNGNTYRLKLKEETAEVLLLFVFQKMTIRLPGGTVHEAGTWVNAGVGEKNEIWEI